MKPINVNNHHLDRALSLTGVDKLLAVMQSLRDPITGCPWDLKQSYDSILPFTLEEVYEVAEAIENKDFASLKDELGDLLFQIVFYARLAEEQGRFDFFAIVENLCDKLIRRHPHVFAEITPGKTDAELHLAWEKQKHLERAGKSAEPEVAQSLLDDIPKALPELKRAQKIQQRVAKQGFDWPCVSQVWHKIDEEILEVKQAAQSGDQDHLEEELGDLLFVMVNLTRHYGFDAETTLRKANQKFEKRFRLLETIAARPINEFDLETLEGFWQQAKRTGS